MVRQVHQVSLSMELKHFEEINIFFSIGIAGIQGPPGDAGEGSFIFARYVQKLNYLNRKLCSFFIESILL